MTATVPDGPFEAAALDACDRDGHPSFRWVPTWGNRGYEECRRCGVHRWVGTKAARDAAIAAGVTHKRAGWADWKVPAAGVVVPVTVALSLGADGLQIDYDGADAARAALRQEPADDRVERIPDKNGNGYVERGPGNRVAIWLYGHSTPSTPKPRPARRRQSPERDAAIVTALAGGARVREVAAQHGLTEARIYQIRDRARKAVQS